MWDAKGFLSLQRHLASSAKVQRPPPHLSLPLLPHILFIMGNFFGASAEEKGEKKRGRGGETCKCEFCHYLTLPFFLFPFFAPGKAVAAISESFLLPPRNSATAEDVDTQQTATSPPAQSRGAVAENETPHIPVGKMTWAQWGVRKGVRGYFLGGKRALFARVQSLRKKQNAHFSFLLRHSLLPQAPSAKALVYLPRKKLSPSLLQNLEAEIISWKENSPICLANTERSCLLNANFLSGFSQEHPPLAKVGGVLHAILQYYGHGRFPSCDNKLSCQHIPGPCTHTRYTHTRGTFPPTRSGRANR